MPDQIRKEKRRKRLQRKKEHNPNPATRGRKKNRRTQYRRSQDTLEETLW